MKYIFLLKNTVHPYAWGSTTAIPELIGVPRANSPQAELWMGAHPKAPSMLNIDNEWIALNEFIKQRPDVVLGSDVAARFNCELPFLFKVLAAAKPLSIQAHPNKAQAETGFFRENQHAIPLDAYNRNYKDPHHKPECICALTSFWALNGFRNIPEIVMLLKPICPNGLEDTLLYFERQSDSRGLRCFFETIMRVSAEDASGMTSEIAVKAGKLAKGEHVYEWIVKLYRDYPEDMGILAPAILNLVCLEPGQAMFLPAGQLHAYLDGLGIELMANSDNVLRGGLTPKHIDLQELMTVLNFSEQPLNVLRPIYERPAEKIYSSTAEEFVLSVVTPQSETVYYSAENRSVEILLCIQGDAVITSEAGDRIPLHKGQSVLVTATAGAYEIRGEAIFYKASVPMQHRGVAGGPKHV